MDNSRLAKLPAELRNRIFKLVFTCAKPVNIIVDTSYPGSFKQDASTSQTLPIALTQTCRTLRQETTKMFYANVSSAFSVPPGAQGVHMWPDITAQAFLLHLDTTQAAAVRTIMLGSAPSLTMVCAMQLQALEVTTKQALAAQLQHGRTVARHFQVESPFCKVCMELLFRDKVEGDATLRFWFKGDEILWDKSLDGVEEMIALAEEQGQAGTVGLYRWLLGLTREVRDEKRS
ncbi:hypothetical protein CLAFUW4_08311 [Fulvia fulva]|uniref:Uncharacterized protein n=1 Tax=Passalora fulva TaxID=5499 RepID=A0A9Q8LCN0_PASFU|nr:uncharacterized protein CLAFUR5_08419 [Fulvia fulva]KAK4629644.1 hypothetical protein CLAFUR4_08316 [Fulvia fulva]KAK4630259.1 hypothetical protein CLAFUR0_08311 [Fulvia fulva]UJO14951.1 hypothetical protein CLAFUR5_08419 [Fulvia fulva]WPV12623.1 hypothetical protein CLAFUW4_08311 [Fulvia fulva]WPV27891.1 hypothetical protein CLAFUW7_08311 [Fulvia fulva]